jgi:hypothetical protein
VPVGDGGMAVADESPWSRHFGIVLSSVDLVADTAERRKINHYVNNCASQGIQFIPLAQETPSG